ERDRPQEVAALAAAAGLRDDQAQSGAEALVVRGFLERQEEVTARLVITDVGRAQDRKSTRLNSSHVKISYAVFCLKKKNAPDTDGQSQENRDGGDPWPMNAEKGAMTLPGVQPAMAQREQWSADRQVMKVGEQAKAL